MPKILINEIDKTTPGAPSGYSNYSVLIAGFRGTTNNKAGNIITSDSNGVYEFSSAGDFEATIGVVNDAKRTEQGVTVYHYGNQMAYMLLKLGYTVVYKAIDTVLPEESEESSDTAKTARTVSFFDIFESTFWAPFRDKASYDFRFVSHGLLESVSTDLADNDEYQDAANALDEIVGEKGKLSVVNNAIEELTRIEEGYKEALETNKDLEKTVFCNNWYSYGEQYAKTLIEADKVSEYYKDFDGFKDGDNYYLSFGDAVDGTKRAKNALEQAKADYELVMQLIVKYKLTEQNINEANVCIANLAKYYTDTTTSIGDNTGRGDCIALIELDENSYKNAVINPEASIIEAIKNVSDAGISGANGKYCALTVPSVVYRNGVKMPGALHYLACFMNSLQSGFAEWYAAAGYTRGVSSLSIDHTTVALGEIAINALEPRNRGTTGLPFACNVIANFRGSYYLWGNRTAHLLGDANGNDGDLVASHFLNIRQLCITIKKQLYVACRRFTFDPNSDTLWFNFVNAIRPTLDAMKADQGIRDYKILKVPTTQKATLKAKIRIIPIEAVEDFDLEISLEDSFGDTAVTATESI